MSLTPKQEILFIYMRVVQRPITVKELIKYFGDVQSSMYCKRLKALQRKGLVKQHYAKGPWSLT